MKTMKCPTCGGAGKVEVTIGTMIRSARLSAGLTQEALSEMAGIGRGQVANIESDRSGCSTKRLQQIAKALGVTAGSLFP